MKFGPRGTPSSVIVVHALITSRNYVPDFEFEVPRAGMLEWSRSRIRCVPALAEVIVVDSNPRTVRLFKGSIGDNGPAEQFGRHEFAGPLRVPGRVVLHFKLETIRRLDQLERRNKLRLDERIGFMGGRHGSIEKNIAVHPHGQLGLVVAAQIFVSDEQVVVVAVIAGRVVVISSHPGGMRLEKRRPATVV